MFRNADDITVALGTPSIHDDAAATKLTTHYPAVGYSYRPIMYVHNIRTEGVTLHVAVTRARQTATGCAKTNKQLDAVCFCGCARRLPSVRPSMPRPWPRRATVLLLYIDTVDEMRVKVNVEMNNAEAELRELLRWTPFSLWTEMVFKCG